MKNRRVGGKEETHLLPPSLPYCQEVKRSAVKLERVSREHSGKELRKGKCQHVQFSISLPQWPVLDGSGRWWKRQMQTSRLQCNLITQKIIDGSTTCPPRQNAAATQAQRGPAISKPGAMRSNCNSVACANPSAQSCRCSSNSFQFWTTFSVMCLCMFLCTGGWKGALRVYMDTMSSCDVPALRNQGNNSHLLLFAQFIWVCLLVF